MARDMVMESLFGGSWLNPMKSGSDSTGKVLGILSFEVAGLMSKVANLWHFLEDGEILKLREQITNSIGIRKLVSEDENYLMDLALNEIIENFGNLATYVARLGMKCTDPVYHCFEYFIRDPVSNNFDWLGWEYRLTKMERKVKKMERYVAVTMQLTRELEVLAEIERTHRRMQRNEGGNRVKLLEFQKKVVLKRQEVKNLREMSPWVRTYDYIVRLLLRSLLTILERIKHVFRNNQMVSVNRNNDVESISNLRLSRNDSFSALIPLPVYPSDHNIHFQQINDRQLNSGYQLNVLQDNRSYLETKRPSPVGVGPVKKCVSIRSNSPNLDNFKTIGTGSFRFIGTYTIKIDKLNNSKLESLFGNDKIYSKLSVFSTKRLLDAPTSTLGEVALSLHYAHIIILIEKLASAPHMISPDSRDDLYNMLPSTIRNCLRARLKSDAKTLTSSINSASFAEECSLVLVQTLGWLAPLAHNMNSWHFERSIEEQHIVSQSNILLVQTLHFANREKTETAIIELLVALNYVCRSKRAHNSKTFETLPAPAKHIFCSENIT